MGSEGESSVSRIRKPATGRGLELTSSLVKIIICEIAVLNAKLSMSSVTFLIVA